VARWLAGSFDPRDRADASRLAVALAPHASTVVVERPLQVAYSGPTAGARAPLCLLDGFLDNASELGAALEAPAGASPEEVLAGGWRRWGPGLLPRLRGDFTLLLWDAERGEGLLARDQLGARSLFLHDTAGPLSFACEIRHLLALLPRRPPPDPVSVAHWLALSNRPGSATLYAGIRRLDPGAMLLLDRDGVREERYWTPRFSEPLDEREPQLAERMRTAIERAVRRRIDPGAPTGMLMSGGLDSASVAAVAAGQAPGRVAAYSGVFPEHPAVDESELVEELRGILNLPGIIAEVRAGGLLASALEAVRAWDVPPLGWGDFWALPLLRAAAGEGVRVVLDGDGGDELFGTRAYLLADRLRAGHPLEALGLARELPGAAYGPARREVARMVAEMAVAGALPYRPHELLRRPLARRDPPTWLRRTAARDLLASDDPLAWKRLEGPRWWANIAHGLTRGIEEAGVFEQRRRRAATAGLEARHPLLDLDLVELGLRQPPAATFDRNRNRPVLRAAMAGLLPDSVRLRPGKAWFDSLIVDCLTGPDGVAVRRLLTDPGAALGAYVDPHGVARELFDSDRLRREQPFRWMWQVWRLLSIACWLRAQADRGDTGPPGNAKRSGGTELPDGSRPSAARIALRPASNPAIAASYVFPP
jgi:asparagine synthase (glutamine-hydrolysing)